MPKKIFFSILIGIAIMFVVSPFVLQGTTTCDAGYYYDSYYGTCKPECGYYSSDQTQCTSMSGCVWDSAYNTCYYASSSTTGGCGSYTTQTSCTSTSGCEWSTTSNYCYSSSTSSSCGSGYYWDSATNICKSSGTSTTCGTGYYWDSATNSCKSSSSSCGSGYYWDSATNMCKSSGTSTTCGTGYYWDSATNSCKSSSSSCGSGYYWDSATNICKSSGTSTTCGTGYYWDSATNSCVSSTGGCGTYTSESSCTAVSSCAWERTYQYCYYKNNTTTSSCAPGTYWDSATNSCKQSSSGCGSFTDQTSCASLAECSWDNTYRICYYNAPSCGVGYYWDPDLSYCKEDCKSYTDQYACKALAGCAWDTVQNKCAFATTSAGKGTITGQALSSGGAAITGVSIWVQFNPKDTSSAGSSFGAQVDQYGKFTAKGNPGTYTIEITTDNPSYIAPVLGAITFVAYESVDLGVIYLSTAQKTIKGKVAFKDGTVVTNASVNAYNTQTKKSVNTKASLTGEYILKMTKGYWEIYVYSEVATPTWIYSQPPQTVSFSDDTKPEEKIINFQVTKTDAAIKGIILLPSGSPPLQNTVFVSFENRSMSESFGANVEIDGKFKTSVPSGTYEVRITSNDPKYTSAPMAQITVQTGETKDMGTIKLITAQKMVTGKVTFSDGTPVTDASIDAWNKNTSNWANTKTDAKGSYTLMLTGGSWELRVNPQSSSSNWNYTDSSKIVAFKEDTTSESQTVLFTVLKTDAKVTGKIVKPDGTLLPEWSASVDFRNNSGMSYHTSIDKTGTFVISLTSGTYDISLWLQDKKYIAPDIPSFKVASGETKNLGSIQLLMATKKITGKIAHKDGAVVTEAWVNAYQKETQQWLSVEPNALGVYELVVKGGIWEVSIHPSSFSPKWSYAEQPTLVVFANDSTTETRTVDFTVQTADAAVKGAVLKPDGTAPTRDSVYINFRNSSGKEVGAPVDSSGKFNVSLPSGTYTVYIHSNDNALRGPEIPSFTVKTAETKDLGTIKLKTLSDHIKGKVVDSAGYPLPNVSVDAYQPQGFGYAYTKTNTSGEFDLLVSSGQWEVNAFADPSSNYYNPEPPKRVDVASGVVVNITVTLAKADAALKGSLVDAEGNALFDVSGYIELSKSSSMKAGGIGGPIERGTFSFNAPSGTYELFVWFPPGSSYTVFETTQATLTPGETKNIKVSVMKNTSKITGRIIDTSGNVITGKKAHVFASSARGMWQEGMFDSVNGVYSVNVAPGTWYVGYDIDPSSGYVSRHEPSIEVIVKEGEIVTKDVVLKKADAIISGRVTDPNGNSVSYAFVGISKTSFSTSEKEEDFKDPIVAGGDTDAQGNYNIAVPSGTYFVKTFVHPEQGFINSAEQKIILAIGETRVLDLQLRKSDVAISGKVYLDETALDHAFVWAWSENGGYQETLVSFDGSYKLNVTSNSKWVVAAAADRKGVFYKSSEIAVAMGATDIKRDIYVTRLSDLPSSVSRTSDATKSTVVEVENAATVVAPANAVISSGTVSITATPDTRTPSQGEVKVVGIAYNLEARDDSGQIITSFNSDVTVSLKYNKEDITALGAKEDDLILSFWDETVGTWKTLKNSIVNKEDNSVTATVDHFTRFAIVSAADIVPPESPTGLAIAVHNNGTVTLTWENPEQDFNHARVYRALLLGGEGSLVASDITTSTYTDSGLTNGTVYYYIIRAVDAAGNETTNTDQVSAVAVGTSVKKKSAETSSSSEPSALAMRLRGRILLQVEVSGEAWFVDENAKRYYMGRPSDAFDLMRAFGLGISNADIKTLFNVVPNGIDKEFPSANQSMAERLSGKILLQVEASGEAYYIYPENKRGYFLGRPSDAFAIMRELGLGISNANLDQIPIAPDSAPIL